MTNVVTLFKVLTLCSTQAFILLLDNKNMLLISTYQISLLFSRGYSLQQCHCKLLKQSNLSKKKNNDSSTPLQVWQFTSYSKNRDIVQQRLVLVSRSCCCVYLDAIARARALWWYIPMAIKVDIWGRICREIRLATNKSFRLRRSIRSAVLHTHIHIHHTRPVFTRTRMANTHTHTPGCK